MALKVTGPNLPPAPDPQERGRVPGVESGSKAAAGSPARPAAAGDGVSISPLARALSALQGMEDVRPEVLAAAQRLLDEKGEVVDEKALRTGLMRLLRLLEA